MTEFFHYFWKGFPFQVTKGNKEPLKNRVDQNKTTTSTATKINQQDKDTCNKYSKKGGMTEHKCKMPTAATFVMCWDDLKLSEAKEVQLYL